MTFSKDNKDDVEFIEQWYKDIETGYKAIGKDYKRPADYIDRAIRVMNESSKRGRITNQFEGKRGHYHEDN